MIKRTVVLFVSFVVICLFLFIPISNHQTEELVTITVTDKDRIVTGSGDQIDSKYLIYTDGEVFENSDDITFGKMNSHDFQSRLKVDSTYTVKVVGMRIENISMTRNIIEIIK